LKIVHVFRAPVGGLFRHVVDLASGQIERGHEVGILADSTAISAVSERTLADIAPKLALGLERIAIARQPHPSDLAVVWKASRFIRRCGAEIVHGHGAKGGAIARTVVTRPGALRVYTPHGGSLHDAVGNRGHLALEKLLMPLGDVYLFESAYSRDAYLRKVGNPRGGTRVVHNGIAASEFEPVALAGNASDIVFVGELRALKGVDVLLEAVALLRGRGRALTVSLVGDGPDAGSFRAQVTRLGLDDAVHFHGALPTRQALAQGRLVVVPSRAESLPYVVLEAAACKPLIATRVGGIPEIFGKLADELVPPDDAAALAQALARYYENPEHAAVMTRALQARIAQGFSLPTMVGSIMYAYEAALAAKAPRLAQGAAHGQLSTGD